MQQIPETRSIHPRRAARRWPVAAALTVIVTVTAAILAMAAFAGVRTASASETPAHQIAQQQLVGHVTGYIDVLASGRYEAILAGPSGTTQTSPVTFSTEAAASSYLAQADLILKDASDPAPKITPRGRQSVQPGWSLNLPCGFTCGADSSDGNHYWVIASYQQIANFSVIAAFSAACLAYLVPVIQGWAAPACGTVAYLLNTLAANQPRVSNHGVWAEIYFSHPWSPQYGRY